MKERGKPIFYIAVWAIAVAFLAILLAIGERARTVLDDPDPAQQRPGILLLSESIQTEIALSEDQPTVVLFARSLSGQEAFHDLSKTATITDNSKLIVVTQDGSRPQVTSGIDAFYEDQSGSIATQLQMPVPDDGGYPIGYAIIDTQGKLRYATLDSGWQHRPNELITVLGAAQ